MSQISVSIFVHPHLYDNIKLLSNHCKSLASLSCLYQAAMGIAELITMAMEKDGLAKEDGLKKIWMVDSKGLIVKVAFPFKFSLHRSVQFAFSPPGLRFFFFYLLPPKSLKHAG